MKYAKIIKYDTGNWDGMTATIFFSGCRFNCPGCFNKVAQDFNYGEEFTEEVIDKFIEYANDEHVTGICILGGEPFQQDLDMLYHFVFRLVIEVGKPIHMWTGYTYEELEKHHECRMVLINIDTLVDGRFMIDKKDLSLKYRGSSNQRVIDVPESIKAGKIIQIKE